MQVLDIHIYIYAHDLLLLLYNIMISTTKQNWNRATIVFLIISIIQIITEYGKLY